MSKNGKQGMKTYVGSGTPEELDKNFYSRLDPDFLLNKAQVLLLLTTDLEGFKGLITRAEGDPNSVAPKFLESLRAEVHFAEFHQFEAMLALLLCQFQGLPHWVYVTTYRTEEIKRAATALAAGNIDTLTDGKLSTLEEFIAWAVYCKFLPDGEAKARWGTSTANLAWLLQHLARRYLEAPEYNAYKHGVRVFTGPSALTVAIEGASEPPTVVASSPDSISFLELREREGDEVRLYLSTRHFNPEVSLAHLTYMARIVESLRATRLARLKGDSKAKFGTFFSLDRENLMGVDRHFRSSFTV